MCMYICIYIYTFICLYIHRVSPRSSGGRTLRREDQYLSIEIQPYLAGGMLLATLTAGWPFQDIVITNIVWCIAYERDVGRESSTVK